jgi:WD40 repeat protein
MVVEAGASASQSAASTTAILKPHRSPTAGVTSLPSPTKSILASPKAITHGAIQDIALSPDGRWLAVASASGLYLHDAQSLVFKRALLDQTWVSGAAFSPDSQSLAVFGKGWLQLLDLNGVHFSNRLQTDLQKLDFSPDGKSLIGLQGWGIPATLQIWELPSWQERQVLLEAEDSPRSMAVSLDGKTITLGGESGWVELFDLESAARLAVLSEWTGRAVTDLAFSPQGDLLAGAEASADGSLRLWSMGEHKKVVEQYNSGYYSINPFVAFSADGERLLGGMGDLAVVWERSSGQQVGLLHGYASFLMDLAISPGGEQVAYATRNWPVFIRSLEGQAPPVVLSVPNYQAFNVAFTPSGKNVAAGLYSYAPEPGEPAEIVQEWNAAVNKPGWTWPRASAAAFQPTDEIVALADSQGNLRVEHISGQFGVCLPGCDCDPAGAQVKSESCIVPLPHELSPMKLAYSPDGEILSAWGVSQAWSGASLIDLETGNELAWFEGGSRISFGAKGLMALGVDELNADHGIAAHWLVLYDLKAGREVRRVEIPAAGVAALSPDGKWLAVGLSSFNVTNPIDRDPPDPQQNGLMFWDIKAWKQVEYLPIHYGITRLVFSPQSDFLVTASETGEILTWKLNP